MRVHTEKVRASGQEDVMETGSNQCKVNMQILSISHYSVNDDNNIIISSDQRL